MNRRGWIRSSFAGDGRKTLRDLATAMREVLGPS
jgi:hypothetical protein